MQIVKPVNKIQGAAGRLKLLVLAALLFGAQPVFSQSSFYWVKFTDKNNNGYTLSMPSAFLSQASIQRRTRQHLNLDSTDLPITAEYIDSILPYVNQLKHRLKWFNLVVVRIDSVELVNELRQKPFIAGVELISRIPPRSVTANNKFEKVTTTVDQSYVYPNPYGAGYRQINMLNVDLLHQLGYTGEGIVIATMDNGWNNVDHIAAFDSVRPNILGTWNFVRDTSYVYNDGSHGTNTLSCMAANQPNRMVGTAPGASYYLLQTEDNTAEWAMEEYNWAAAAEYADSLGAQILSTSLGYTKFDNGDGSHTAAELDGHTALMSRAANLAFGKGMLVVNSAGNEGANANWQYHISVPADGDSVLAIGAVDSAEVIANFSGRGLTSLQLPTIKPNVCAMGSGCGVISTNGAVGISAGTSFSCPILAGSAACLWQAFPEKTAREIFDLIVQSGSHRFSPDTIYGYGVPNFYNAYLLAKTNFNTTILSYNDDFLVFPNPFTSEVNVSYYNRAAGWHKLEVLDMQGRRMFYKDFYLRPQTYELMQLEGLSDLAAGKYLLRIDNSRKYTYPIVKARGF